MLDDRNTCTYLSQTNGDARLVKLRLGNQSTALGIPATWKDPSEVLWNRATQISHGSTTSYQVPTPRCFARTSPYPGLIDRGPWIACPQFEPTYIIVVIDILGGPVLSHQDLNPCFFCTYYIISGYCKPISLNCVYSTWCRSIQASSRRGSHRDKTARQDHDHAASY
jgi:hypothetical protein